MKRLFLDDYRDPQDCVQYMYWRTSEAPIYLEKWEVVRNYTQFKNWLKINKLPDIVSFDYDLEENGKNGYDCALLLFRYCKMYKLKLPKILIHSMNPVGVEKIKQLVYS